MLDCLRIYFPVFSILDCKRRYASIYHFCSVRHFKTPAHLWLYLYPGISDCYLHSIPIMKVIPNLKIKKLFQFFWILNILQNPAKCVLLLNVLLQVRSCDKSLSWTFLCPWSSWNPRFFIFPFLTAYFSYTPDLLLNNWWRIFRVCPQSWLPCSCPYHCCLGICPRARSSSFGVSTCLLPSII